MVLTDPILSLTKQARHKVRAFLRNHTLPDAVKDTAYMVECLAAAAPGPTLKELGPGLLLPDAAEAAALPARTLAWRTRLLANAARFSGAALLPYLAPTAIPALLALTLEHEEKDVRKAGGKLLRRCLQVRGPIQIDANHLNHPAASSSSLSPSLVCSR